jgi:DNA-binding transcriptional LysR family regulator
MRRSNSLLATKVGYFLAVAELGSIRAASRELNIASSAINRQILQLEEIMGQPLFERVGRGLVLSEAGDILARHLKTVLHGFDDTLGSIDSLKGLQSGTVRVATVESVSVDLLPDLLTAFSDRYPGIEVRLTVTGSDAVTRLVLEREVHLGFTFNPTSLEGLTVGFEKALKIGAIVSPGHPLSGRKDLALEECFRYPLALPAPGLSLRAALDVVLSKLNTQPRKRLEANSLRVMSTLARDGRLVAFQTEVGIESDLKAGTLVFIPLNDPDLPLDRLMLVRQSGRQLSPAAQAFFEHTIASIRAD